MSRIQKRNKNIEKTNKNISTEEKNPSDKMKIQTFPLNIIASKKKKKSKEKSQEQNKSQNSIDSAEIVKKEIEITKKLTNLLEQKKEELEKIKIDTIEEVNGINNEISSKNLKIDSLTKSTSTLLNKITLISEDIDLQYSKYNIDKELEKQKVQKYEKKIFENNLKINILRSKNSIQHNNNIIQKLKTQKEKLEKINNEETDKKLDEYKIILEKLVKRENKIKKDIIILNNIKNKHIKLCDKKKENLRKLLNRVQNEYKYQEKRKEINSFISLKSNDDKNAKIIKPIRIIGKTDLDASDIKESNTFINNNKSQPRINKNKITILLGKDTNNNKYLNDKLLFKNNKDNDIIIHKTFSDKNILKNPLINEYSDIRSFPTKNNVEKHLFEIKKEIALLKKLKGEPFLNNSTNNSLLSNIDINNNTNKTNIVNKTNNDTSINNTDSRFLFSKTEMCLLSKIVPNECLDKYKEKFNSLEKQRLLLKEKIKDNITKKKINSHQNFEIDLAQMKKKASGQKAIKLHSKLSDIKKNITKIKVENNNLSAKLIDIKKKYKFKKIENEKMMKYFNVLYSDIKDNKIKLKKGHKLNNDEIKALNKWGGPSELYIIQNNEEYEEEDINREDNKELYLKENDKNNKEENEDEEIEENEMNDS